MLALAAVLAATVLTGGAAIAGSSTRPAAAGGPCRRGAAGTGTRRAVVAKREVTDHAARLGSRTLGLGDARDRRGARLVVPPGGVAAPPAAAQTVKVVQGPNGKQQLVVLKSPAARDDRAPLRWCTR